MVNLLLREDILAAAIQDHQHLVGRIRDEKSFATLEPANGEALHIKSSDILVVIANSLTVKIPDGCKLCNSNSRIDRCFCSPEVLMLVDKTTKTVHSVYSVLSINIKVVIVNLYNFENSVLFHQRSLPAYNDDDDIIAKSIACVMKRGCQVSKLPYACIHLQKKVAKCFQLSPAIVSKTGSSALSELAKRSEQLENLASFDSATICPCVQNLRCWVHVFQTLLDIIMGMGLFLLIYLYGKELSDWLKSYSETLIKLMMSLLEWLMGVPAGLKLNYKLTKGLGKFFTFHVWVWAGYLTLVGEYLVEVIQVIGWFGLIGGFSFQIALIQDLLRLSTLHLFCFYIYTVRLYSLISHTIVSLFRLFRGKKWNTLRLRVDTADYDTLQLFLGTLVFSILLFLTPTILLYYLVFTMFRIVVKVLQGTLEYSRNQLHGSNLLLRLMILLKSSFLKAAKNMAQILSTAYYTASLLPSFSYQFSHMHCFGIFPDRYRMKISTVSSRQVTVILIDEMQSATYNDAVKIMKLCSPSTVIFPTIELLSIVRGDIV